jgi:hypothetical protein
MEDLLDSYRQWIKKPDWERYNQVKKLLDFDIAGEDNNKMMCFFLMLGNYHKNLKTTIMYRGDSSAGKNHVINNVIKLFPEKDVYLFDSATAKALNYDDTLNNCKMIYLRELEHHQSLVEIMKSLSNSGGRVHKETIKNSQTDEHSVKEHILDQKGIIMTFSFENIQVDMVNRSWVLNPDQSYEQTQKVTTFDINNEINLIERDIQRKEIDHERFFISQCITLLEKDFNYKVMIPFIKKLEVLLPSTQLNVRRDKNKLFNLIRIITLWNQNNRKSFKMNDDNYLLAEYTDLKMALQICQEMFINLVLHLDDTKRTILDYMAVMDEVRAEKVGVEQKNITSAFGNQSESKNVESSAYTITEILEDIRDELSISRSTLKRKLDDLFYEGYLVRTKPKGRLLYQKLRDYNLVNVLKLDDIEDEVSSMVEQTFNYYNNLNEEVLDDEPEPEDPEEEDF